MSPSESELLAKLIEERQEVCTEIASIECQLAESKDTGEEWRGKILAKLGYCRSRAKDLETDVYRLTSLEKGRHNLELKKLEFDREVALAQAKTENLRIQSEQEKAHAEARAQEEKTKQMRFAHEAALMCEVTARKAKEQEEKTKRTQIHHDSEYQQYRAFAKIVREELIDQAKFETLMDRARETAEQFIRQSQP